MPLQQLEKINSSADTFNKLAKKRKLFMQTIPKNHGNGKHYRNKPITVVYVLGGKPNVKVFKVRGNKQ